MKRGEKRREKRDFVTFFFVCVCVPPLFFTPWRMKRKKTSKFDRSLRERLISREERTFGEESERSKGGEDEGDCKDDDDGKDKPFSLSSSRLLFFLPLSRQTESKKRRYLLRMFGGGE